MGPNQVEIHKSILELFVNTTDHPTESYYGVNLTKSKKSKRYQVKLLFDYKKRPITSESLSIIDLSQALKIVELLEINVKDKLVASEADNLFLKDLHTDATKPKDLTQDTVGVKENQPDKGENFLALEEAIDGAEEFLAFMEGISNKKNTISPSRELQ